MNSWLTCSTQSQVTGPRVPHNRPSGQFGLDWVARCDHNHTRKRPHDSEIFGRVMGHAKGTVGKPASDRHDLDIRIVIAHVIPDLLQTPKRWKVRN